MQLTLSGTTVTKEASASVADSAVAICRHLAHANPLVDSDTQADAASGASLRELDVRSARSNSHDPRTGPLIDVSNQLSCKCRQPGGRKSGLSRSPDVASVREWRRPTFLEREKLERRRRQNSDVANRTRLVSGRSRPCRRTRREDHSANRSDRGRVDAIQESPRLSPGTRHERPGQQGTNHDAMPPLPLGTRVQERAGRRHHNDWRRAPSQPREQHLLIREDESGGLRRLRTAPVFRRTRRTAEARRIKALDAGVTLETDTDDGAARSTVIEDRSVPSDASDELLRTVS